jgi:hypothetical protein
MNTLPRRTHLLRLIFGELNAQLKYLHDPRVTLTEFKTRGGAHIPWVVTVPELGTLAITADADSQASDRSLQSLTAYCKRKPGTRALALHEGDEAYLSSRNSVPCIPVRWIF